MDTEIDIVSDLEEKIEKVGWTCSEFARRTGFPVMRIWRWAKKQGKHPRELDDWLDKLADWLEKNPPPHRNDLYE